MARMHWLGRVGWAFFPRWNPPQGYRRWNQIRMLRVGPLVVAFSDGIE